MSERFVALEVPFLMGEREFPVSLFFDATLPFEVCLTFHTARGDVEWQVSRDLLRDGLTYYHSRNPSADFQTWCSRDNKWVHILVQVPDGTAEAKCWWLNMYSFIRRCDHLVPKGQEYDRLDWDTTITKILEG